jgi:phenylpropionate dioxygenase-like ring-hydroxylating dioxygenase large terminal subunit
MSSTIERGAYFTSLTRDYFFSPELYERELDVIFRRQWLYVGHVSEIAEVGDYLRRDVVGESVLVVRAEDGINAFLNVCRHRGSRICDAASGRVKRFICPYHRWSFDLDGSLHNAPSIRDGEFVDFAEWGLHQVHVDVWLGMIFINLTEEQPDPVSVSAVLEEVTPAMARLEPEHMKVAHAITYDVEVNWKVLLENYWECYHCPGAHPELCRVAPIDNHYIAPEEAPAEAPRDLPEIFGGALDYKPGLKSLSIDGEWACSKLLGEFGRGADPTDFAAGFAVLPAFTGANFSPDYGVIHEFRPLALDRVRFVNHWLVHQDAVAGEDYEIDKLIALWDITNRQDIELCERVQAGIHSRRFVPGPNSLHERSLRHALTIYLDRMERES